MKKTLLEALEALQEEPLGPYMGYTEPTRFDTSGARALLPKKTNPRAWRMDQSDDEFPYDDSVGGGPANATGKTGQQGVGRGGIGGREDVSGGPPTPSSAYVKTWQQDEGADFDELGRHGAPRNQWRDTPEGQELRHSIEDEEELEEAMGTPYNFTQAYGHGNNMTAATNAGVQTGWARSPNLGDNDEEDKMELREFFDPTPIPVDEETEEQERRGPDIAAGEEEDDSSEQEIEIELEPLGDSESGPVEFGDEPEEAPDEEEPELPEPGDGNDLGSPENILLAPHAGSPTDFVMSPDKMGAARGSFGMQADGAAPGGDLVDKSSAWDVLAKVVGALGNEPQKAPVPSPMVGEAWTRLLEMMDDNSKK